MGPRAGPVCRGPRGDVSSEGAPQDVCDVQKPARAAEQRQGGRGARDGYHDRLDHRVEGLRARGQRRQRRQRGSGGEGGDSEGDGGRTMFVTRGASARTTTRDARVLLFCPLTAYTRRPENAVGVVLRVGVCEGGMQRGCAHRPRPHIVSLWLCSRIDRGPRSCGVGLSEPGPCRSITGKLGSLPLRDTVISSVLRGDVDFKTHTKNVTGRNALARPENVWRVIRYRLRMRTTCAHLSLRPRR